MLRDIFRTVRDIIILSLLTYIIVTPEVYGRWKAKVELAFFQESERIGLWSE